MDALLAWAGLNALLATYPPHTQHLTIPEPGEAWAP
jgi:hypothetical protein